MAKIKDGVERPSPIPKLTQCRVQRAQSGDRPQRQWQTPGPFGEPEQPKAERGRREGQLAPAEIGSNRQAIVGARDRKSPAPEQVQTDTPGQLGYGDLVRIPQSTRPDAGNQAHYGYDQGKAKPANSGALGRVTPAAERPQLAPSPKL